MVYFIYYNMIIVPTESTKLHTPTIQPYYLKSFQKMQFESDTHIYEIMNDKVYKMKVLETINDHKLDGNGEVDVNLMFHLKNENVEKTETFYIPINLQYKKITIEKYKLNQNSLLTLFIENNKTFYFQTNEKDITHSIKEDMITFLSLLKLYK